MAPKIIIEKKDILNAGLNRLKKILENPKDDSEIYVLAIGTNDIFLPYLRSVSLFWKINMTIRCKIKECIEDNLCFQEKFEELIKIFHDNQKKLIVFGSPDINHVRFPTEKLIERNKIMNEICTQYNYKFIDIYKLELEKLPKENRVCSWKATFLIRNLDAIIMTLCPSLKDEFARKRGLITSVDGIDMNSISAKLLAGEVERELREI